MFKRAFYSLLALGLAAPALAKVDAVDGYVRLLPPGSPNTAAFLVLKNDADKSVKLVAAASPEVGRAELHTHLHENGVMKMRQVESIEDAGKRGSGAQTRQLPHHAVRGARAVSGHSLPADPDHG